MTTPELAVLFGLLAVGLSGAVWLHDQIEAEVARWRAEREARRE